MTLTAKQHEERRTGIGGSEIGAVLGLNPWSTAVDVFFRLRPDIATEFGWEPKPVEGAAIDLGHMMEEPLAAYYTKITGRKVRRRTVTLRDKKQDYLIANLDRIVVGEKRGLEIKTAGWKTAGNWGTGPTDVPEYYLPQVQQYEVVTGFPVFDVIAAIGGNDVRQYEVEADPEWEDIIRDGARDFWENHVVPGIPPEFDYDNRNTGAVIRRMYPGTDGAIVTLPDADAHWFNVWQEAQEHAKRYERVAEVARWHLEAAMRNAAVGIIPGVEGGLTRKAVKRRAFEVKAAEYVAFNYSKRLKAPEPSGGEESK